MCAFAGRFLLEIETCHTTTKMNQADTEGEDAESKIRRLLETAGFPAGTTVRPTIAHNQKPPKGADALSGAAATRPGVHVRIPTGGRERAGSPSDRPAARHSVTANGQESRPKVSWSDGHRH